MQIETVARIIAAPTVKDEIIAHCRRKLAGIHLAGEEGRPKAFGLVGGRVENGAARAEQVIALKKNVRNIEPHRSAMDRQMERYAVPSETPLSGRGWVADPAEMREAVYILKVRGLRLIGTYHMHRVAWEDDPIRDTPTLLDAILGRDSRLLMFIVSMTDPEKPVIRAYKEGDPEKEVEIEWQP